MTKEEYKNENKQKGLEHLSKLLNEISLKKFEQIKKLAESTPNDMDFGREVRKILQ